MLIVALTLLVGLVIFLYCSYKNPADNTMARVGYAMFCCGLLVFLMYLAQGHTFAQIHWSLQ